MPKLLSSPVGIRLWLCIVVTAALSSPLWVTDTSLSLRDSWPLMSTLDKAKDTTLWHVSFINNFPEQNSSVISPTRFCQSFSNRIAVVTSGNIASWFRSLLWPLEVARVSVSSCYTSLSWKIIFSPSYFDVSPCSFAVMRYLMLHGKHTTLWAISQHSLYDTIQNCCLERKIVGEQSASAPALGRCSLGFLSLMACSENCAVLFSVQTVSC